MRRLRGLVRSWLSKKASSSTRTFAPRRVDIGLQAWVPIGCGVAAFGAPVGFAPTMDRSYGGVFRISSPLPQRDLHLMHLAIIAQRQEIARYGPAIDRHVEGRVPVRRSVVAHVKRVGCLAVTIGDFIARPAGGDVWHNDQTDAGATLNSV